MTSRCWVAAIVLALLTSGAPALAKVESAPVITDRTRATLVTEGAVVPGASVPIALRLQLKPGWHTYWRNPGDSGEPASVTLHVQGKKITGPDIWPMPERIDIAGIVSYGHHGDVTLVTTVPMPSSMTPGTALSVEAEATWLVCEKVCVPERGRFALTLPVAADAATAGRPGASPLVPPSLPTAAGLFARTDQTVTLRVPASMLGRADGGISGAYFFPDRGDVIDHSAPQVLREQAGEIVLALASAQLNAAVPPELRGVLAVTRQRPDGTRQNQAFQLSARPVAEAR